MLWRRKQLQVTLLCWRLENYNMEDPLLSQSSDQNMEYNKQEYQYSEKSSSLKGLYQSNPELQEQYSKQHSGSGRYNTLTSLEESLWPLVTKVNFESEANECLKSGSSILVPLVDQDSIFSPLKSDNEAQFAEEEDEKATVIQRLYREKLKKRKELQEENEKASVIQKMYRIKIQKRKEKDEENEKATVIQQLYRKKLQKRKEQQEENDKATLIQRKYRIKLQERKQKEEENEKASMIQKMYRAKKVKQQLRDNKEGK